MNVNEFNVGDRVIISSDAYSTLTPAGMSSFYASGKPLLTGVVVEDGWGHPSLIPVAIDDGKKLGFGHGGYTNGINVVEPEYLTKIYDSRKSIYD